VFQVTSGQDYSITASTSLDVPKSPDWRNLSNSNWMKTYKDDYVSGYSDLILVLDAASSKVVIQQDWSYYFDPSNPNNCDWRVTRNVSDMPITANLGAPKQILIPDGRDNYRIIYPVRMGSAYNFSFHEHEQWPPIFEDVHVPSRYNDRLSLCTRTDGTMWLGRPSSVSFRVDYAFAKVRPYGSKIQIGIPFLVIVVVANGLKVLCIYFTLRQCSSGSIVTVGDAVATFLRDPDPLTKDKCMYTQAQLLEKSGEKVEPRPWKQERRRKAAVIGGKGVTIFNL
jgi:hypothetical protein